MANITAGMKAKSIALGLSIESRNFSTGPEVQTRFRIIDPRAQRSLTPWLSLASTHRNLDQLQREKETGP